MGRTTLVRIEVDVLKKLEARFPNLNNAQRITALHDESLTVNVEKMWKRLENILNGQKK